MKLAIGPKPQNKTRRNFKKKKLKAYNDELKSSNLKDDPDLCSESEELQLGVLNIRRARSEQLFPKREGTNILKRNSLARGKKKEVEKDKVRWGGDRKRRQHKSLLVSQSTSQNHYVQQ